MKKLRNVICSILAVLMLFSVTACGDGAGSGDGGSEVRIFLWSDTGSTPDGFDEVVNYFNTTYGPELGLTVKFTFDTQDQYKQKLNLAMSAKQNNYDMVFDANWIYLNQFAQKGYYYNLYDYFKEGSKYEGLSANFDDEYLKNNFFNNGLYGIPLTETFGEISVAYIRKDWRKECAADTAYKMPDGVKYNSSNKTVTYADLTDGIDDFDELQYYLYWVRDHKEGVTPILSNSNATWGAWDVINSRNLPSHSAGDFTKAGIKQEIVLSGDITATAYIDEGEVVAANVTDEREDAPKGLSSYPAGFNTYDNKWQEDYEFAYKWAQDGIISKDVLSVTDSDARFKAGTGGCVVQTINNFNNVEAALKSQCGNAAELEIFVNEQALREKKAGYARTDFKAWNFLCIPVTVSKNKMEKCLTFMNWLFSSRENHDLFQYGIKGKHWDEAKDGNGNAIENTVVQSLENAYLFPAYLLTWNPNYIRVNEASDPKVREYMEYMYDRDRYVGIPYSGFSFNHQRTQELQTALANAKISENRAKEKAYMLGQISDPINKWNAELSQRYDDSSLQSALTVIKNEVIYQLQQFIDSQG